MAYITDVGLGMLRILASDDSPKGLKARRAMDRRERVVAAGEELFRSKPIGCSCLEDGPR